MVRCSSESKVEQRRGWGTGFHKSCVALVGLATAALLGGLGGLVLPFRRREQKARFAAQVDKLARSVDGSLSGRLERELHRVADRIVESVAPYSRFVKLEEGRTRAADEKVRGMQGQIKALKQRVLK